MFGLVQLPRIYLADAVTAIPGISGTGAEQQPCGKFKSPVARKNWIHIGSPRAGPKVAAILVVVESCHRLNLPARNYLGSILPGLADRPI